MQQKQMHAEYAAFISYTHADPDERVAARIQRQLEHYRIPGKLRRETGRTRIGRVFRDREELALTSDLTTEIRQALEQSEYLIVICSPNAMESEWVAREIDLFAAFHGVERILTVLAAGEPEEVIPVRLTKGGREPLSCDYRLPAGTAGREELPRLAAALLSCSYDDLRRRQHQYRTRRNAVIGTCVAVAFACVSGYLTWNNVRIRRLLRETQVNESRLLARSSTEALGDGDRIRAIRLAMSALSGDNPGEDRPEIPEAIHALEESLEVYIPEGTNHIQASRAFSCDQEIRQTFVSGDGAYLAVCTDQGLLIWDTESGSLTGRCTFQNAGGRADAPAPISDEHGGIVVSDGADLLDVRLSDGVELWRVTLPADERPEILGLAAVPGKGDAVWFAAVTADRAVLIDGATHRVLQQLRAEQISTETVRYQFLPAYTASAAEPRPDRGTHPDVLVSSEGTNLWICVGAAGVDYNFGRLVCWDTGRNTYRVLRSGWTCRQGQALIMTTDDQIVLAGFETANDQADNRLVRGGSSALRTELRNRGKLTVAAIETETGKLVWRKEISFAGRTKSGTHLAVLPGGMLAAAVSEECVVLDGKTGNVRKSFSFPSEVLSVCGREDGVLCFLQNGSEAAGLLRNGQVSLTQGFVDDGETVLPVGKDQSRNGRNLWFVVEESRVVRYEQGAGNPDVEVLAGFAGNMAAATYSASVISDTGMLLEVSAVENDSRTFTWFPKDGIECAWEWQVPGQTFVSGVEYCENAGQIVLAARTMKNNAVLWRLICIDVKDGTAHERELPTGDAAAASGESEQRYSGLLPDERETQILAVSEPEQNRVAYVFQKEAKTWLGIYDIVNDAAEELVISDAAELCDRVRIEPELSGILVKLSLPAADQEGRWLLVDDSFAEAPEQVLETSPRTDIRMSADAGDLAVCECNGNWIRILQRDGKAEVLEHLSYLPMDLHLDETGLYVLESNGTLHVYERSTLTEVKRVDTTRFAEVIRGRGDAETEVQWERSGRTLWICSAGELVVVDLDAGCVRTTVHDCIGYTPDHAYFYVTAEGEKKLPGRIPHYSTNELLQMGNNLIEG